LDGDERVDMRFIAKQDAKPVEKKLRRQIAELAEPKLVLCYKSGNRDYSDAANAITASLGKFTEATLCFLFCISGNGWNLELQTAPRWLRYRQWQVAQGENRRLYDAPVHQFESDEAAQLSRNIAFALDLGWDALLGVKPGRQLLFLSHNDRIEVYRGFGGRSLAAKLIALGYWRR
jgi:hypothetical protein